MLATPERAARNGTPALGPPVPRTLEETGLSADFVADLLLKVLMVHGPQAGRDLSSAVCLPFQLIDDLILTLQQRQMVEVRGVSGLGRAGYTFAVAGPGRERAQEALAASQYTGPAPVTLETYREWVLSQGIGGVQVTRDQLALGFSDAVLGAELLDELGPAVNSGKSMFLHGAPGNGKTLIAEHVSRLLGGAIYVPHAVKIDGHVVIVYDPVVHRPAQVADAGAERTDVDARFVLVRRPVVLTGGELTLEELDLQFEPFAKTYQAPFQMKANGGVLIVDDFGRQRVPPRDLLNRWIVPLERRVDYLMLHTGTKFPVPFDCLVIFATNLDPDDLVEEAFLRRIHYKIFVAAPDRAQFTEIFRRCCVERGIDFQQAGVDYLFAHTYGEEGIEPRACHPRDLLDHLVDTARFLDVRPELSAELLARACRSYFIASAPGAGGATRPAALPRLR